MEEEANQPPLIATLQENKLPLVLLVIGVLTIIAGIRIYFASQNQEKVVFNENEAQAQTQTAQTEITVHIAGSIENPGVYTIPAISRVQDLIDRAGGFSQEANEEFIGKQLNLAQKLVDGQKIYVPETGETATAIQGSEMAGISTSMISINSASSGELDTLPGVGPVTADKIIDGRPYGSLEDLVSRKIISQKLFENIKDSLSL
ncbi:hypothetical protein C4579_02675 [Candidatus Microgenomates bacterium]|nr:MAG: hypothetical protein C4579_02675 [Candidatus Microgenomates bacterium]